MSSSDDMASAALQSALRTLDAEASGVTALAAACFDFLPQRALLDLAGWDEVDIFAHS